MGVCLVCKVPTGVVDLDLARPRFRIRIRFRFRSPLLTSHITYCFRSVSRHNESPSD